jgi:lipopolysaccharide export system protein LptA
MAMRALTLTLPQALPQCLGRSLLTAGLIATSVAPMASPPAIAQGNPQAMQLRANVTQANAKTGVVVARGNVQIDYPARDIKATAAQATYYSREARIVLSGNVYVLQQGNSLKGEVITYLVNEGRFEALPQAGQQVEAIYLLPADASAAPAPVAPAPGVAKPAAPQKDPFPAPQAP